MQQTTTQKMLVEALQLLEELESEMTTTVIDDLLLQASQHFEQS